MRQIDPDDANQGDIVYHAEFYISGQRIAATYAPDNSISLVDKFGMHRELMTEQTEI